MALMRLRFRPSVIVILLPSLLVILLTSSPAFAQEQLSAALSPNLSAPDWMRSELPESPAIKAQPKPEERSQRVMFVLPNYLTVESLQQREPLTPAQKFKLVGRNTFDPAEYGFYALRSGIMQGQNKPESYGSGMAGYGRRYALTVADCTVENFMAGAVFPSLLHQDPRYFRMAHGLKKKRFVYALSRVVLTRSDSGATQFNYSELFGGGAAAAISTYGYHPQAEHSFSGVASTWGSQVAFHGLTLVVREFWPDVHRILTQKN